MSAEEKIIYARAYTYEHQYNLLLGLAAKMSEEPFRLLVRPFSFWLLIMLCLDHNSIFLA